MQEKSVDKGGTSRIWHSRKEVSCSMEEFHRLGHIGKVLLCSSSLKGDHNKP